MISQLEFIARDEGDVDTENDPTWQCDEREYIAPVWGLVVKRLVHWAHDPWVMGSSPTTRRWIWSNLPLPPTTPTSPPSCEWVPGVSWGANRSSFSLNSSGQGGTSGAHSTCCEKVAGPPASS